MLRLPMIGCLGGYPPMNNSENKQNQAPGDLSLESLPQEILTILRPRINEFIVAQPHIEGATSTLLEKEQVNSIADDQQTEGGLRYIRQLKAGGHGGGESIKPKNVTLKLRGLCGFAATSIVMLVGVGSNPILLVLAVLGAAYGGVELMEKRLTEQEASIIWAASKSEILVKEDVLADRTNEQRQKYGLPPLSGQQFRTALESLVELGCMERSGIFSFRLVESVSI
jgi:hypothetical protein